MSANPSVVARLDPAQEWGIKAEVSESADGYRRSLAQLVRGLWSGVITLEDFYLAFGSALERGLTQAWYEGASQCGIAPDELTNDERLELKRHILIGRMAMGKFGDSIATLSKAEGARLSPHLERLKIWANRWNEAYNHAQTMACADQKLIWLLGATKRHCISCAGFANRVYRASIWAKNSARPQGRNLYCGGYRCGCRLEPTDQPVNRGRFPSRLLRL